jgi:hypothetical protein
MSIVCIKCYMYLTFVSNCPLVLYYSPYTITVMIECITMNWDQCRDIKYDTLTQNSIQWKCDIIDHLQKLLWTWHPPYCYTWHDCQQRKIKTNIILCKLILKSEEQYDYKLFARSGVKRMIGCCVTSGISSIVALHCI